MHQSTFFPMPTFFFCAKVILYAESIPTVQRVLPHMGIFLLHGSQSVTQHFNDAIVFLVVSNSAW